MQPPDRRRAPRVACALDAWLDEGTAPTRVSDLSASGAFVETLAAPPPGARVTLRFRIGAAFVETAGEVRYVVPNIGVGIRFIDFGAPDRAIIEAFVAARLGGAGDAE